MESILKAVRTSCRKMEGQENKFNFKGVGQLGIEIKIIVH